LDTAKARPIHIAIDVATKHQHISDVCTQIRNELGHGATVAEIMEVLQLTNVLGNNTISRNDLTMARLRVVVLA
jgi:alkylhydroperoxidase/carboxymuconolactone decarboxylase family protein YurZ